VRVFAIISIHEAKLLSVAANHGPPMTVTSRIRTAYAFVTSRNATPFFQFRYFISDVLTSARLKKMLQEAFILFYCISCMMCKRHNSQINSSNNKLLQY